MSVLDQLNTEIAAIVDRVGSSLVEVRDGRRGGAGGTIWHTEGLIVTNAHIIGRSHPRVITSDGRELPARILAIDRDRDLAAISVHATGLTPIALGDSMSLQAGQFVLALGHPWGVKGVATAGVLMSGSAEYLRVSFAQDMVEVNLPLRPGNSGGPLVDTDGRLIGINTMMTGPDTGLAIPVHCAKKFLHGELGHRPWHQG